MVAIARILIIDDSPKYLADALPLYGYEVEVANDGLQGVKKLTAENSNFDMVLLDVMMPNMDGWETLKAIRNNKKFENIPIIMITALNEEQKEISGLKFGADDYVVKPFILPNLLARIEALLRRSTWRKEKSGNVDLKFVQEGKAVGTSAQFPIQIGETAVDYASKVINGEEVEHTTLIPSIFIDETNVDEYIKVYSE